MIPRPLITTWMVNNDGGRTRSFDVDGCSISVRPSDGDQDTRAAQFTTELAAAAVGITERWTALEAERDEAVRRAAELSRENARLSRLVPPPEPVRTLAPGCVRFADDGRLWLLNRREGGWASWGVPCTGWDDLFRRYAVRITEHGTDEHGAYWITVPGAR